MKKQRIFFHQNLKLKGIHAIFISLDSGEFACPIFVDLKKAFDTVNHEILLKKLEHYGLRGKTNSWFRSYLENRKN